MRGPDIAIDYLANCPEFIDELARLSWEEWREVYQQRKQTLEHSVTNYRERMNTDQLPLTLVALHARELVGMVSLKFHDMDTRPDLDPWLGGLLVLPEWRKHGVGTMLMYRATEEARRLNVPRLYLWTHTAERLYHKLDWQVSRTNQLLRQRSRGDAKGSSRAVADEKPTSASWVSIRSIVQLSFDRLRNRNRI